jgi:hypothetical protein
MTKDERPKTDSGEAPPPGMYYTPRELLPYIEIRTETGRFLKDAADWLVKGLTVNPPYSGV